jgi:lipid-A-disaccharide synthase
VVFYKISPITFFIAKRLTHVKFISLVNIIAGHEIVREFLQSDATPTNIIDELFRILDDQSYRNAILTNLRKIRDRVGTQRPSERVATIIGEITGWNHDAIHSI